MVQIFTADFSKSRHHTEGVCARYASENGKPTCGATMPFLKYQCRVPAEPLISWYQKVVDQNRDTYLNEAGRFDRLRWCRAIGISANTHDYLIVGQQAKTGSRSGPIENLEFETVDKILTGLGRQDLLSIWYPAPVENPEEGDDLAQAC